MGYLLNRPVFENICENKNNTKMGCHGGCQLVKKINQDKSKDYFLTLNKIEDASDLILFKGLSFILNYFNSLMGQKLYCKSTNENYTYFLDNIWRPPVV